MSIENNEVQTLVRVKGNREAIGATLQDVNKTALNLTDRTIVFRLVKRSDGTVKVDNQAATIDDADSGKVSYTPAAGDVDTAGQYAAYFLDTTETPNKRFPYDGARFLVNIIEEKDS